MYYFGTPIWGLCAKRISSLLSVYNEYNNLGHYIDLIAITRNNRGSQIYKWTSKYNIPICIDKKGNPTWKSWNAQLRHLYIIDGQGNCIYTININYSFDNNLIIEALNNVLTKLYTNN